MTPVAELQQLLRRLAADQDPTGNWKLRIAVTGSVDDATVGATQVLFYLAEKRRLLPPELEPLLQPGTMALWRRVLTARAAEAAAYLRRSFRWAFLA